MVKVCQPLFLLLTSQHAYALLEWIVDFVLGLQCHTAPFSWKLVFEHDHRLFEMTMSACSPKEEVEWRTRLTDHSCKETPDAGEEAVLTSLSLDIKPLGTVFGKPGKKRLRSPIGS